MSKHFPGMQYSYPMMGLGIANPAATFCVKAGGKSSVDGYCTLPNGTRCEQWAFMRGECGKGVAVGASRETDIGILWAAYAQAQGLVDALADQGSDASGELKSQLYTLGQVIDDIDRKSKDISDADWAKDRQKLLTQLEGLRVAASRALTDKRRNDQFLAASIGALVALSGVGVWALFTRKRKNR